MIPDAKKGESIINPYSDSIKPANRKHHIFITKDFEKYSISFKKYLIRFRKKLPVRKKIIKITFSSVFFPRGTARLISSFLKEMVKSK